MALELQINGYLEMTISHRESLDLVSEDEEKEILGKLQKGVYVIGIASKKIFNINHLNPDDYLYNIDIESTEDCEYEFDEFDLF